MKNLDSVVWRSLQPIEHKRKVEIKMVFSKHLLRGPLLKVENQGKEQ